MMILVSGLPGSGKSFFASRLAKRLNADYISSDLVRKTLQATGKYAFEDKFRIYRYMAEKAVKLTRQGNTVVVDATFYHHSMRALFMDAAEQNKCRIYFIVIEASEQLVKERLAQPRQDSEADLGVYQSMKTQFERYAQPHLRLQSEADNIEQMLAAAVEYLSENDGKC